MEAPPTPTDFEGCYDAHVQLTAAIAMAIVTEPHEVWDVVQEIWLSLFTHWDGVVKAKDPKAWIARVARNRAISSFRSTRGRPRHEELAEGGPHEPATPDRLSQIEAKEFLDRVARLVPPDDLQMIADSLVDERSEEEMARARRISRGGLLHRLRRAQARVAAASRSLLGGRPSTGTIKAGGKR